PLFRHRYDLVAFTNNWRRAISRVLEIRRQAVVAAANLLPGCSADIEADRVHRTVAENDHEAFVDRAKIGAAVVGLRLDIDLLGRLHLSAGIGAITGGKTDGVVVPAVHPPLVLVAAAGIPARIISEGAIDEFLADHHGRGRAI